MYTQPLRKEKNLADAAGFSIDDVAKGVDNARDALLKLQKADGHWAFPLEADATIPAEYILLQHFLDEINQPLHDKMAVYLRNDQSNVHDGWALFHGGDFNISTSVKAYFALKAAGDSADAPHMIRGRDAILKHGGLAKCNVFTRIQLALFGILPWHAVPVMPIEIMVLPRWFPFHLSKVAYWSRTVIVPLLVLMTLKPQAVNPKKITLDELFVAPPETVKDWNSNETKSILNPIFRVLDDVLRFFEPYMPKGLRQYSIDKAVAFVKERLNGEDGLGAIYPAMANVVMMYSALGYDKNHPDRVIATKAVDNLVIEEKTSAYCQPCFSPIWDTALMAHAMLEDGSPEAIAATRRAAEWLKKLQVLDVVGDWANWRPNVRPGGWAFQYNNAYYPDLDDTAVVVMAMDRLDSAKYREAIERGTEWVLGLQSKNGGWGAFDADNTYYYLNHIPFADHGALLDPPSADVTARCLGMLAQLGYKIDHPAVAASIAYLRKEQEKEGCWFGRWGTNYIYGTWSVLNALNAIGIGKNDLMVRRAINWLVSKQRDDGGWGEDGASYWSDQPKGEGKVSTPAQTAWAILGLMAFGEIDSDAVNKGINYLLKTQTPEGLWNEDYYTAVGFPKVFYLRYHGYKAFFPQWALARYKTLKNSNASQTMFGM
ncbi:MAG: squalene--hopene cyclase [Alphaproteobacteria bacterium]|nr:squalene--hopene cyclase [Alphaproteobacteria bacterium]